MKPYAFVTLYVRLLRPYCRGQWCAVKYSWCTVTVVFSVENCVLGGACASILVPEPGTPAVQEGLLLT